MLLELPGRKTPLKGPGVARLVWRVGEAAQACTLCHARVPRGLRILSGKSVWEVQTADTVEPMSLAPSCVR